MSYNHDKRTVELSTEGETIQTYLLSTKYPQITIKVESQTLLSKFWNWLVG